MIKRVATLLLVCLIGGCSAFGSPYQTIRVISGTPGEKVYVNGEFKGETPLSVELRRNQGTPVIGVGDSSRELRTLRSEPSTLGVIDILGGCVILLPFFGLLSDAAWEYKPDAVIVP